MGFPDLLKAAVTDTGFEYQVTGDEILITGFDCSRLGDADMPALDIPAMIEGFPVTEIGDEAFLNCQHLALVRIPDTVEIIGNSAFVCPNLVSVNCGSGLVSVESSAFSTSTLKRIYFKGDAPSFGSWVFGYFNEVDIYFRNGTTGWDDVSFNSLIYQLRPLPFTFKIVDDVAHVTGIVCESEYIELPEIFELYPVELIDPLAFAGCAEIRMVSLPGSILKIGDEAFSNCLNLDRIYVDGDAPEYGTGVFLNTPIRTVYYSADSIGWEAFFSGIPTLSSQDPTEFEYEIDSGSAVITGYDCSSTVLQIPQTIRGCDVIALDEDAFRACNTLKSVTVPEPVVSIGSACFYECSSLVEANLPEGLLTIGSSAFGRCAELVSISIPDGVEVIENSAFSDCYKLEAVSFGKNVTSIGAAAFRYCKFRNIRIPDSVTTIGFQAFESCTELEWASIGDGVVDIGSYAFIHCDSLQKVYIGESVSQLRLNIFLFCGNLSEIYFFGNAPTIESDSFSGTAPEQIFYLPTTDGWTSTFAGSPTYPFLFRFLVLGNEVAISGFTCEENAFVPDNIKGLPVTSIAAGAFSNCADLKSIRIPASVTLIENEAFEGCSGLETVYFDGPPPHYEGNPFPDSNLLNNVTRDMDAAGWSSDFAGLSVQSVSKPNELVYKYFDRSISIYGYSETGTEVIVPPIIEGMEVTRIAANAFQYCEMETLVLPETLVLVESGAFSRCHNLSSINIPPGIDTIDSFVFERCSALTHIDIPNTVTTIGHDAFLNSGLTDLVIPESVNSIALKAFYDCDNLTSVHIKGSTEIIDTYAFGECDLLRDLYFYADPPIVSNGIFNGGFTKYVFYSKGLENWPEELSRAKTYPFIPDDILISFSRSGATIFCFPQPGEILALETSSDLVNWEEISVSQDDGVHMRFFFNRMSEYMDKDTYYRLRNVEN